MDYNHISGFLDKFKKIFSEKDDLRNAIVLVISKNLSFQLKTENIKIKDNLVKINGSPILRNEIFMHKEKILKDLSIVLPNNNIKDII